MTKIAFADDQDAIAISPEVETAAMSAWVATDRISWALGWADGARLQPASLRPLIIALDPFMPRLAADALLAADPP